MTEPIVSVITPAYNAERYIGACIESVQQQTEVPVEHIVIDDGSTDATPQILERFPHVRLLRQRNKGAAAARNRGIHAARGTLIKFLDADDELATEALYNQVIKRASRDASEIGYGHTTVIQPSGQRTVRTRVDTWGPKEARILDLMQRNIQTGMALYPRRALERVGGFDERLHARQEWDLNLRLVCRGFIFRSDDVLVYKQRLHGGANRISNRKLDAEQELYGLRCTYEAIRDYFNEDLHAAWASYVWQAGRQCTLKGDPKAAAILFDEAKRISPEGYWKYLSRKYRTATAVFGPYIPDLCLGVLLRRRRA
ncbi:glycosyltransferase family 2 protein [Arhodomonas sp. SL1]|uniref:glycosyltransferase family 2 protein n=1 Tax=Arhodomonas sp. SL1 TaxID=3425691 RepID=UPI003F88544A